MLLGGIGLDQLAAVPARRRAWGLGWARSAWPPGSAGGAGGRHRPRRAAAPTTGPLAHYAEAAAQTPGADPATTATAPSARSAQTLDFVPRYLGLAAGAVARAGRRWPRSGGAAAWAPTLVRPALLGLTLLDLFGFGFGLNPAIAAADDRPETPGDRLPPARGRPVRPGPRARRGTAAEHR